MSICANSGVNENSSVNWWSFPNNNEKSFKKNPLEVSLAANSVMYAASMQANATQK